jgi:hypothetical protein
MTLRSVILLAALLPLAVPLPAAQAQSGNAERLVAAERRLDALERRPAGQTLAQASESERLTAIERRLDALERRLGNPPQAQPQPQPQVPSQQPSPTAAVQLPSGAIQQVPQATAAVPAAAPASYRALGLKKGMTEPEVVELLGPPLRIRRGVVDVYFYGKTISPNVNFQYGRVIDWND